MPDSNRNDTESTDTPEQAEEQQPTEARPVEIGGRKGPDPTRFGDWEKDGRCVDF
ncbi:MAG: DUF1674 domain-containing protein [Pseudomonadota bacterium]